MMMHRTLGELVLWLVKASALVAVCLALMLCGMSERAYADPPEAWHAPDFWYTDINGNNLSGSAIDVNTLQQGMYVTLEFVKAGYVGTDIYDDQTGENIVKANSSSDSDDGYVTFYYSLGTIIPGHTYTIVGSYGYFDKEGNHIVGQRSFSFSATGGEEDGSGDGTGEGEGTGDPVEDPSGETGGGTEPEVPDENTGGADVPEVPDTSNGQGDNGPSTSGNEQPTDGTSDKNQQAETNAAPSGQSSTASADTSTNKTSLSPDASASEGTLSSASATAEVEGENLEDAPASGDVDGGRGQELLTQAASASTAASGTTGAALARMGQVYGLAGSAGGASGSGSQQSQNAMNLVIEGLPYLWVLLCALMIGAAPLGVAYKYARYRQGLACSYGRLS